MSANPVRVQQTKPRENAQVTFLDGSVWCAPIGTPLEAYFKAAYPDLIPTTHRPDDDPDQIAIAAIVDGTLRELTFPIKRDAMVRPVMLSDGDGLRIYRRSLSLLLLVAARRLFPARKLTMDHSLPFGGLYCAVVQGEPFTAGDLKRIKKVMRELVEADEPITRMVVPLEEVIDYFRQQSDDDKLRLMENRARDYLILYELCGLKDYFYGYMLPSTGYLTTFDLTHDGEGFILHHPRRHAPSRLQPITALPKLRAVFRESGHWLDLLGIPDIGALNQAIRAGRTRELVLVAEALHEGRFGDMADAIVERQPDVKLILIAGPSSSGKTTSAKRLTVQLMAHGMKPYPIGLDDFFVDRDETPRDENGQLDYEHLHAVDLDLFNKTLIRLMDGEEVQLPHYNFHTGRKEPGKVVQLSREHLIIVEGIHGLNPELIRDVPPERVFRLYVSCLTQLNIDRHNRVPTTDVRLLRRVVRDARFRGYSAQQTLSRWPMVREGEGRWIFPFQENADIMFNSSLVYELALLRPKALPLLLQVEPGSREFMEAKRLLAFLNWVEPLDDDRLVPDNSLLREFLGGSILADYTPGQMAKAEDGRKGKIE